MALNKISDICARVTQKEEGVYGQSGEESNHIN